MSTPSIILSFDDLQNVSNDRFNFFQDIKLDVDRVTYSFPTYLFLTSFALSTNRGNYAAIAHPFSVTLTSLGISMDNQGIITIELKSFVNYVQTVLGITTDEIDVYALFKDYAQKEGFPIKRESVMISLPI